MATAEWIITGLLSAIVYSCFYRWSLHRNRQGPKVWPILGCWIELNANKYRFYDWLQPYFEHFTTVSVPSVSIDFVLTSDPASVEYILKTNFNNYPKGELTHSLSEEMLGDGIINVDGDSWKRQRKIGSYAFSSKVLRDYTTNEIRQSAVKLTRILDAAIHQKLQLDMQDIFRRMMLDTICKVDVGFGTEVGTRHPLLPKYQFGESLDTAALIVAARFINPLWKLLKFLGVGQEGALTGHVKVMHDFTYNVINDRIADLDSAPASNREIRSDVLSCFVVEARDHVARGGSTNALRDSILSFTIASHVTSATSLSWLLYLVSTHPEVEHKILEELLDFEAKLAIGDSPTGKQARVEEFAAAITFEALNRMQYLHAAVTETLRLYPAVPLSSRICERDDVLPDGTRVKKGNMIAYVGYCMARLERLWGKDAAQFRPERWLKDGIFQPESSFKYAAFHAGPRTCMGKDYAYLQNKMTAAILFRFYKFQLVPGKTVRYSNTLVLAMKDGLTMTVCKRNT